MSADIIRNRRLQSASIKCTLCTVLVLICTSVVWGQSTLNSQPNPQYLPDHPQHADVHPMGIEVPLASSGVTTGVGERPLSECYKPVEVDLAEFARQYRAEHAKAPQSGTVYTN